VTGRIAVVLILVAAAIGGVAMWWLQLYAFYDRLDSVDLSVTQGGTERPLAVSQVDAITSESSPIRFRACFMVDEVPTGDPHPDPTPLVTPGWFDCFDTGQIVADLESGAATALIGTRNIEYGIDRVLAIYPDGRGVAWHQINICGRELFEGKPPPEGCPPPPE